jgi:hypothetical protein
MSEQMKLLGECSDTIDSVRRLEHKLKEEEENLPGFVNLNSTETQTAGECIVLGSRKSVTQDPEGLCDMLLPWSCLAASSSSNDLP